MPEIIIPSHDGESFKAYVALPDQPAPVVIMIQEIFGVNKDMRAKCDEMAEMGYVAICPDLFWRIEPGIELIDSNPAQLERAFELFGMFDVENGVKDLVSTVNYAREFDACRGKIGCIGYCLGGKLAYMLAYSSDIDASVSYYGVGIEDMIPQSQNIKGRVLMHVAEEDEFVSKDAQEQIKLGLMPNRRFEIYTYPGAKHAFARKDGMHYDPMSAREANERTKEFLENFLTE